MTDLKVTLSGITLPTNTSGTVYLYEDVGDDGGASSVTIGGTTVNYDNTDSTALASGTTTYILSGFDGSGGNRIWPRYELDNTNNISTAELVEATTITAGNFWVWDDFQSQSGVVHQSTANTDHNDAATLKQGYDYATFSEITPDPVACWPLHEDSGATAYDVAGTKDGTINGATIGQTGLLGTTAYSFDGTDDYVDIPNFNQFSSYTISAWMNTDVVGSFSSSLRAVSIGQNNEVWVGQNSNGDLQMQHYDGSNFINFTRAATSGEWVHACITWDGSTVIAYYDAVQNGTASTTNMGTFNRSDSIGQRGDSNGYWDGFISDVRVYNNALTGTEVQTLYDVVATQGNLTTQFKPI